MSWDVERASSPRRTASVTLSIVGLVTLVGGWLLHLPFWAAFGLPLILAAVAVVLAVAARKDGQRRPTAIVVSIVTLVAVVASLAISFAAGSGSQATYQLTVTSTAEIDVVIQDGTKLTEERWASGKTITLMSDAQVVSIGAQTTDPTVVISCELSRDGSVVATDERAGSVNCSYVKGSN